MRLAICGFLLSLSCWAQTSSGPLESGAIEFKQGHYAQAAQYFQEVATADPNNVTAHLYLGTALLMQYVPGLESRENTEFAERARAELQKALGLDPRNKLALASLASLAYNQKRFDESKDWYVKVIEADPSNKEAYYTLGVIAWAEWLPVDRQARTDSGQRPEDRGPISNERLRRELKAKWLPILDEGIRNVDTALGIDPNYSDAMAYMNLLIRYRADLLDSQDQYVSEVKRADEWVNKALETKKAAAQEGQRPASVQPDKPASPASAPNRPMSIRVGGAVSGANLISRVAPVYPPLAREAGITGTVSFNVEIGRDGHVANLTLVSGHPLLVEAARDAVMQWVYKPTLLNGEPVIVKTIIDVKFSLLP